MKVLDLSCEQCDVRLGDHTAWQGHRWRLRLTDRALLSAGDMKRIVEQVGARQSFDLPGPAERRHIRLSAGQTQEQVAELLGVTRDAVGRWEKTGPGRRDPRPETAALYAVVLDELRESAADPSGSGGVSGRHRVTL